MPIVSLSAIDDQEAAVRDRYTAAAREVEPDLCCPVEYRGPFTEASSPCCGTNGSCC